MDKFLIFLFFFQVAHSGRNVFAAQVRKQCNLI